MKRLIYLLAGIWALTGCHEPDTSVLQQDKTVLQTHTDSIE